MIEGKAIKKPIPVSFVQWFKHGDHSAVGHWGGNRDYGYIKTLEGGLEVVPGTYIMGPGAGGEYWPIRKDIFEKTYQIIEMRGDGTSPLTVEAGK
jgi:hypothetical protein